MHLRASTKEDARRPDPAGANVHPLPARLRTWAQVSPDGPAAAPSASWLCADPQTPNLRRRFCGCSRRPEVCVNFRNSRGVRPGKGRRLERRSDPL